MIGIGEVRAIIPTRGDVPMEPILEHLKQYPEIDQVDVIVGNTTFNRYKAALECDREIIYTQDDDCITDIRILLDNYNPKCIVNAMTKHHAKLYPRAQTLVGFGAIFHKSLIKSILHPKWIKDDLFYSKSDRIFATINRHKSYFPKIETFPYATDESRLWRQRDHIKNVNAINYRIKKLTGITPI